MFCKSLHDSDSDSDRCIDDSAAMLEVYYRYVATL